MSDKINSKIGSLIEQALTEKTGFSFHIIVGQDNDCNFLNCTILPSHKEERRVDFDNWMRGSLEEITQIINKATSMIWNSPLRPGYNMWTLKNGCIHWSYSDGILGGDGTTITGGIESQIDEFWVFKDGEFQETVGFVNGVRDDSVDISSYARDNDYEFCEEPYT